MEKEEIIKDIDTPNGYELDKTESTLLHVVFKKTKKDVKVWKDIYNMSGYFITTDGDINFYPNRSCYDYNKSLARTEKVAKSMIAMAQISQLMPYYDVFTDSEYKSLYFTCYMPVYNFDERKISVKCSSHDVVQRLLLFHTQEKAEEFIKNNEQLVKDYLMVD